jgi:hypothetical protein
MKITRRSPIGPSSAWRRRLVFADKFFAIFEKTDENDDGGPRKADKKHHFQQPHGKHSK